MSLLMAPGLRRGGRRRQRNGRHSAVIAASAGISWRPTCRNDSRMTRPFDVIVVGVGGMGSAACWQLARRGLRVLGLERFDIPHAYRLVARADAHHPPRLLREPGLRAAAPTRLRAVARGRGDAFGEPLLVTTGSLDAGAGRRRLSSPGSLAVCREHGLPHEILSGAEINRRFPGFRLPADHLRSFQPDGGFVASRARDRRPCDAGAGGGRRDPRARSGARLVADRRRRRARRDRPRRATRPARLILSPGAWIADFVPALKTLAVPERQVLGWFQPTAIRRRSRPTRFPVPILTVEEGPYYRCRSGAFRASRSACTIISRARASRHAVARGDGRGRGRCCASASPATSRDANGPAMALAHLPLTPTRRTSTSSSTRCPATTM